MKVLLLLFLLVLAGIGFYRFYLPDHPISWLRGPETLDKGSPAPTAKKDFKDLSAVLQGDMDRIPRDLREARQMPTHAFDVKSRVAPHLQEHTEYRTLTQVCDLIINADQDFSERQGKCGLGQVGAGSTAPERARASAGPSAAAYQQQEPLWDGRRRQTDNDVRLKLASLENRRL